MKKFLLVLLCLSCSLFSYSHDWEHVSLSGGVEAVANYSWRGFAQGGLSVQPWLEFSAYGVTVGTWANVGMDGYEKPIGFYPEIDVYLSYTCPGEWATAKVTHYYYFGGSKYFNFAYDADKVGTTQDEVELTIRPLMFMEENNGLEIGAAVMIGGGDCYSLGDTSITYYTDNTETLAKKLYSTYIYLKYTTEIENWEIESEIGFSPHKSMYTYYDALNDSHKKFALNNISCKATYTFYNNDIISLYAFGAVRFNLYDVGYQAFKYGKNFGWNLGLGFEL